MKKILDNSSIEKRLLSTLIVWMTILISFGILAIVKMGQLAQVTQHIYDYPLQVSKAIKETQINTIKLHREMKDIILSSNEEEIKNHQDIIDDLNKKVSDNIQFIKRHTSSEEVIKLEKDMETILNKWKQERDEVISLTKSGKIKDARSISQNTKNTNSPYVNEIEENLNRVDELEGIIASNLLMDARKIESSHKKILIFSLITLGFIAILFFVLVIKSIIKPIEVLKKVMSTGVDTGELLRSNLEGDNELVDMSHYFNMLICKLKAQLWIKDGQNRLSEIISGNHSLNEVTQGAINFLARFLEAGNGVFYLYNEKDKYLQLNASFAFTERDLLFDKYVVGEGIVGQVALEKKSILLKDIKRQDVVITTGTISTTPISIYAFPLLYEGNLYGVIELSFLQPFTELKQEFLKQSSRIIEINLYSVMQNEKMKNLLEESEKAKREIESTAKELQKVNIVLEEQQVLLQQQTEELQKTNVELEEQHQLLQQQSEELQQSNTQLEEQQQLLEEQSSILNNQNKELGISREELIRRTEELELASRYKSEFLANMSHELRTPLNSIILLSKLLINNKKDELSKDNFDKISIIHNSGKELLRLINDILDLSKIEAGKLDLNVTSFHSKDLLKTLKNIFDEIAEEKNIKFIMEDYVNSELTGDMDKISQILRNLIANGIKFTEQGSVVLKVERDIKRENDVLFSVMDTGIGIRYEQIHMIFEKFQQGDGSISRKYGGTGLGLSISKKLAEFMKGDIEVYSNKDKGSNFRLILPNLIKNDYDNKKVEELVAYTDESIEQTLNQSKENNKKQNYLICRTNKEHALNLNGKKILIVDDDPRNIFVMASALEDFGADVYDAENGEDAIEKLKKIVVDLVLMDIMMPVMDGYEAIKAIRTDENLKELPIIALTAKSLKEDRAKCISVGADDYISKPVDYDTFVRLIKAWIGKKE